MTSFSIAPGMARYVYASWVDNILLLAQRQSGGANSRPAVDFAAYTSAGEKFPLAQRFNSLPLMWSTSMFMPRMEARLGYVGGKPVLGTPMEVVGGPNFSLSYNLEELTPASLQSETPEYQRSYIVRAEGENVIPGGGDEALAWFQRISRVEEVVSVAGVVHRLDRHAETSNLPAGVKKDYRRNCDSRTLAVLRTDGFNSYYSLPRPLYASLISPDGLVVAAVSSGQVHMIDLA